MSAALTFASATRGILHWLNNLDLRRGFICLGLLGFIVFFADKNYGVAFQYLPLIVINLIVDLNRVQGISRAVGSAVLVVCWIGMMLVAGYLFFEWWSLPNLPELPL
jgi:hypothetical protein